MVSCGEGQRPTLAVLQNKAKRSQIKLARNLASKKSPPQEMNIPPLTDNCL